MQPSNNKNKKKNLKKPNILQRNYLQNHEHDFDKTQAYEFVTNKCTKFILQSACIRSPEEPQIFTTSKVLLIQ